MTRTSEKQIIAYTRKKVKQLFINFPVPAHSFDHVSRVRNWAIKIAQAEGADVFLAEMAAWLHDIGRTKEINNRVDNRAHHLLSYELCREWFKSDPVLKILTVQDKKILLYSVLYHWNNEACKYETAWILRDADKLDILGKAGIKRLQEFYKGDDERLNNFYRILWDIVMNFKTKSAKRILKQKNLLSPVMSAYKKYLRSKIADIKL